MRSWNLRGGNIVFQRGEKRHRARRRPLRVQHEVAFGRSACVLELPKCAAEVSLSRTCNILDALVVECCSDKTEGKNKTHTHTHTHTHTRARIHGSQQQQVQIQIQTSRTWRAGHFLFFFLFYLSANDGHILMLHTHQINISRLHIMFTRWRWEGCQARKPRKFFFPSLCLNPTRP